MDRGFENNRGWFSLSKHIFLLLLSPTQGLIIDVKPAYITYVALRKFGADSEIEHYFAAVDLRHNLLCHKKHNIDLKTWWMNE